MRQTGCLLLALEKALYEYPFEGEILRGDIGDDGFAAVVVREKTGNLSQDSGLKILMLSSKGKLIWSYSLNRAVNIVKSLRTLSMLPMTLGF